MTQNEFIALLNEDLRREYAHMHFYLLSSVKVVGMHREEIREFLTKQAASEMKHVQQFSDLIVGLGSVPECMPSDFPTHYETPEDILGHAYKMEIVVSSNYAERMDQAECLDRANRKWVEAFLENQIIDSRSDADHIRMMLV